jgi:hypothetical protein
MFSSRIQLTTLIFSNMYLFTAKEKFIGGIEVFGSASKKLKGIRFYRLQY